MDRATADDLDGHYALSSEQVEAYIENGFVRLKQVPGCICTTSSCCDGAARLMTPLDNNTCKNFKLTILTSV